MDVKDFKNLKTLSFSQMWEKYIGLAQFNPSLLSFGERGYRKRVFSCAPLCLQFCSCHLSHCHPTLSVTR